MIDRGESWGCTSGGVSPPKKRTSAGGARFRTEALSGGIQKWSVEHYKRLLDIAAAPPAGLYRIVTDEGDGRTWLATPDYQRIAAFKKPAVDPKPSLFSGRLLGASSLLCLFDHRA